VCKGNNTQRSPLKFILLHNFFEKGNIIKICFYPTTKHILHTIRYHQKPRFICSFLQLKKGTLVTKQFVITGYNNEAQRNGGTVIRGHANQRRSATRELLSKIKNICCLWITGLGKLDLVRCYMDRKFGHKKGSRSPLDCPM